MMNNIIITRYNYLIVITFTANQNTQSSTNGRSIKDYDHEFGEACRKITDSGLIIKAHRRIRNIYVYYWNEQE